MVQWLVYWLRPCEVQIQFASLQPISCSSSAKVLVLEFPVFKMATVAVCYIIENAR